MKLSKKNVEHIKNYFNITYGIKFVLEKDYLKTGDTYYIYQEWWNERENRLIISIDHTNNIIVIDRSSKEVYDDLYIKHYQNYKEVIEELKECYITSPAIQQYRRDKYIQELLVELPEQSSGVK